MADRNIDRAPERGLSASDDIHKHQEVLGKAMTEAEEILERYSRAHGDRTALIAELKRTDKLSSLLQTLRQLRDAELDKHGLLYEMDKSDGSYDRRGTHRRLNGLITNLRGLDINLNRMYGTRMVRKISAWFGETLPKWLTVEWRAFKDDAKHFLRTAGVVGLAGAGLTVGGYALAYGGFTPGFSALGGHLGQAGSYIASQWGRLFGKGAPPVA